jgi:hypothetical protein
MNGTGPRETHCRTSRAYSLHCRARQPASTTLLHPAPASWSSEAELASDRSWKEHLDSRGARRRLRVRRWAIWWRWHVLLSLCSHSQPHSERVSVRLAVRATESLAKVESFRSSGALSDVALLRLNCYRDPFAHRPLHATAIGSWNSRLAAALFFHPLPPVLRLERTLLRPLMQRQTPGPQARACLSQV